MNFVYAAIWLLALFKWGDIKNWRKYYPTFLYFVIGDLLYLYLLSDLYPMWRYSPQGVDDDIGITNTHVNLSIILIKYPATILIFLSKFPKENLMKKIGFLLFWVILYGINELIDLKLNLIQYDHNWNFYWSLLFNLAMFIILRIHYSRPILAWLCSIFFMLFLWQIFDVPKQVWR